MTAIPGGLAPRRPAVKPLHVIVLGMIAFSVALAYFGLRESFRPYTQRIDEAVSVGRSVQLQGFLGSTGAYDADGNFTFDLQDETGKMIKVVYAQPKPSNFEQAISIVAVGHYDAAKGVFIAEELLVKCPSKYQEAAQ